MAIFAAVDRRGELVELVQPPFLGAPVEPVAPVLDQRLQVGRVGAVVPADVLQLIGEACPREPLFQVAQHRVRDVDREGDDRVAGRLCGLAGEGRDSRHRKQQGDEGAAHQSPHGPEV
jgi:hypothetical protein